MTKTVIHLVAIVVLYALFYGLIYVMAVNAGGGQPLLQKANVVASDGDGEKYREDFRKWTQILMGVSFAATLVWYVSAEWSFRVAIPVAVSKRLIWFLWLAVTVLAAFAAEFWGPKASLNGHIPTLFYFLGGAGFYYLATALFSPVNYKYTPPGAVFVRFI